MQQRVAVARLSSIRRSRDSLAAILDRPLLFAVGTGSLGCSSSLEGHMYVSETSDGPADYAIVVGGLKPWPVPVNRWELIGDASGDFGVVVTEGAVENETLVGLPEMSLLGGYWWSPKGMAMSDTGEVTFSPETAVRSLPHTRLPFLGK